jgi:glycosyltransferase involved in cell wall biosynthesis
VFVQFDAHYGGSPISGAMVVRALVAAGWQVDAVFASPGPMTQEYEKMGCYVHILPHGQWLAGGSAWRRVKRWVKEWAGAARFIRLLRRKKPHLVYVNNLTGFAAVAAARVLRIPTVWHLRELFDDVGGEMHPPLGGKRLARWIVNRLPSRIVAISESVAENVCGPGPGSRAEIVANAVTAAFFDDCRTPDQCRAALGLPMGGRLIGVPGTLRPVKGHDLFVEAAARIQASVPDCRFAITGDGRPAYRQGLEARIDQLGLRDRTHFAGVLTDMPAFYRACDLVCVPSRSESFGRTAIEAMAVGTPVVATAVGGLRETIEHETTGLLVPYGDADALAASLVRLLNDRALAGRLAAAARAKAQACYREEVYQERICRIVEEVVGPSGARP